VPGVCRYAFSRGLDQVLLLEGGLEEVAVHTAVLIQQASSAPDGGGQDQDRVALLPHSWARGLLAEGEAGEVRHWLEQGWRPFSLASLPWPASKSPALSGLWSELECYRQASDPAAATPEAGSIAATLACLQLERRLRHRIDPRSWPAPPWRPPIDPRGWLSGDVEIGPQQADQLIALLHLIPEGEQPAFAGQLAAALPPLLAAEPSQEWRWHLVAVTIGGVNSRQPVLTILGRELRRRAVGLALDLSDPMARATQLIRLLDLEICRQDPRPLQSLAAALDAALMQIKEASSRGQAGRRRLLQRQLADALRGAGGNLQLMQQLALTLSERSCAQLPQLLSPSACLQLLKGVVLLDRDAVAALPIERQQALVMLFERLLPRVWWQADLLQVLLRDLRRFQVDLDWLGDHDAPLLPGLLRLHRLQVAPASLQTGDDTTATVEALVLLRRQLLLLLRLSGGLRDRTKLLRRLQELSPGGAARCWLGEDQAPILEAACAGLGNQTISLLRLWAEGRGVPALLPLLPDQGGVAVAFEAVLDHWRSQLPAPGSCRNPASIAMLITTFRPDLARLKQALDSLSLQTLQPVEVLVVDDGSPPAEAATLGRLIKRYREDHGLPLRLLRQEVNRGQYACRNLAIAATTAELIAIQDDDDLSHPLRLELQAMALQENALACYAKHIRLDERSGQPQPDGDGSRVVGDGITTLMVRRRTAVALGGFYPVRSRGDVEFRTRLSRDFGAGAIHWLDKPLYLMRGAPTTISSGFEYGCSLRLPTWRRLVKEGYLA
jgi:hypothetical protein